MSFCQWPKMVLKVGKMFFLLQQWVKIGQNSLFDPLWTHFETLTQTHV